MADTIGEWIAKAAAQVTKEAIIEAAVQVAIAVGQAYLQQAMMDTPDATSAQGSFKQAIPPRIRGYGKVRVPVYLTLWDAVDNYAYDAGVWHAFKAQSLVEVWSHDNKLTLNGSGWVQNDPKYGGGDGDLIHVDWNLGEPVETAFPALVSALGPLGRWSANHRGDGLATVGFDYHHAKKENLTKDFPNGDPNWSVVGELSPIWDPRDEDQEPDDDSNWEALENTALQIMDLLAHPAGFAEDYETTIGPVLEGWIEEADICDEPVALKAGGTAPRFRSRDFYAVSDDPQEILNRLLTACNGVLTMDANGCHRLWVGKTRTPTVHLTEDDIVDYQVDGDPSVELVVNEIIPRYKSEEHKWELVETEAWRVSTDADERGRVETSPLDLISVGDNSQARRLAKREAARQLAQLRGVLYCKLSAERAVGARWVTVTLPELGLENAVIELEDGGSTSFSTGRVSLPFTLADMNADAWNAATEEGDGPRTEDSVVPDALAAPSIDDVEVFTDEGGVRLRPTLTGPARNDLNWAFRWRVSGDVSWVEGSYLDLDPGATVVLETGFVPAGATLETQGAYLTGGGQMSPWSATETVDTTLADDPAETALQAYLAVLDVQPSPSQANRLRTLIDALIGGGVWAQLDWLWVAGHHAQAARVNLRNPAQAMTAVNNPVFTPNRWWQGNGTSSRLEPGFDPSAGGHLFAQNDAHMGVWVANEGQNITPVMGNEQSRITVRNTSDQINIRANATTSNTDAETSAVGFTSWSRDNSANFKIYKNGVLQSSPTRTSAAPVSGQGVWFLGSNNTGTDSFCTQQAKAGTIGAHLTGAQELALYTALDGYFDGLDLLPAGATVQPPESPTATGGVGQVTVGWRNPPSTFAYVKLKRGTTNVEGSATTLGTQYVDAPGQVKSVVDSGLSAGTYYYWIVAYDHNGGASTSVGPVSAVVT